jgi:hypothetical protein
MFHLLQAQPLLRDRKKFTQMADPLLEGKYPIKSLYQALAVAAMCLQEEADTRPLISDVVTALEFLAKKKDDDDDGENVTKESFSSQSESDNGNNESNEVKNDDDEEDEDDDGDDDDDDEEEDDDDDDDEDDDDDDEDVKVKRRHSQ